MGRTRTWRRMLPVTRLAWTGFYAFFFCSALAVAQFQDTCTELPELDVTRNGSKIILHLARPASSSQVNETSCLCYPVLKDEQHFLNFTCDNATFSSATCWNVAPNRDENIEIDMDEENSSGNSFICHFSNCGKKNCSIYEASKDIASISDLNFTLVNRSTAFVSWSVHHPYGLGVSGFHLTWCTEQANCSYDATCLGSGPQSRDGNVTDTNALIGDLSPATSLRLRVSPLGIQGNFSLGCIEVPPEEPESTEDIKATLHGLDGLQVQWTQQDSLNASLDHYEFRYCLNEEEERCPEYQERFLNDCMNTVFEAELNMNSYKILGLKPKSAVVVGVLTKRRYPSRVVTKSKESVSCFKAPAPGNISGLHVQDITSRNATVLWTFEQDGYQELRPASYSVTWCVASEQRCPLNALVSILCHQPYQSTVKASQARINIGNLLPWSAISVKVRAMYMNGSDHVALGDSGYLCFETLAEAPGKPEDFRVTAVESTSTEIEWTEPRIKNGALGGYIINMCKGNERVEIDCKEAPSFQLTINDSSTTEHKLDGLDPWTNYTVALVAFNRDANGSEMISDVSTVVFQTDAVAPGSVTRLSVVEVTNCSISLDWSKPNITRGEVKYYNVTYCIAASCESATDACDTFQVDEEEANITNLKPWTFIAIRVAAVNLMKNGTELLGDAASLCERTKIGVPSRPESINAAAKGDSIVIRWKPPRVPNGELSQYKVDVCGENESTETRCDNHTVGGGRTTIAIQHLAPWTVYNVSVAAQNIEGDLVLQSESVNTTVKTAPAASSKPRNFITTEEEHSIIVSWEAPELPRGPLDGYNVSWIIEDWLGRVTAMGSLVTSNNTCRLPVWKPYSNYTLSVRAFHQIEDAEPLYGDAALTAFKTAVDAPDLAKVDIVAGPRSAAIFLSVAGSLNGPLDGFLWCNYVTYNYLSAKNKTGEEGLCPNGSRTTRRLLLLKHLKPWTSYTFAARAYNFDSEGSPLEGQETWIYYMTEQDAPSTPRNFSVARFESRSLIVNWSEPAEKNGELEGYVLTWTLSADGREINHVDISPRSTKISSLEPYTEYVLRLRAYNKHHSKRLEGPPVEIHAKTLPEAPGPIVDLNLMAFKNNSVHLSWHPPLQKRGELQSYVVIYNASKLGKPSLANVLSDSLPVASVCHGKPVVCTFVVEELRAEYVYSFDVRGLNVNVSTLGDGLESPLKVEVPAGDPPPPKNTSLVATDCPSAPEPDSQKRFMIFADMFDDKNGAIIHYDVVIGSAELIDEDLENGTTWKEVSRYQPTPPHIITPQGWNPFLKENHGEDPLNCEPLKGRNGTMICTIGSEICEDDRVIPCNGPLRGGTEYAMYIIGYTKGGSRASYPVVFVTALPEEPSSAGAIAGGILTAIIIMAAILAVIVIHRRRMARQKQANSKRTSADPCNINNSLMHLVQMSDINGLATKPNPPAMPDEQIEMEHHVIKDINKPIPKMEFRSHLEMMMKDSAYRFADEYERLVELSPQYPSDVARHPANSKKNRFTNIHPFDKSRVPLSLIGEDEQSSYINASFVKGCNSEREYIAAQGPNAHTVNDFWRMIWEHDVKIIIMLTQFVEANKKKCEKYWPDDNKEHAYGSVEVRKDSVKEKDDFILTEFRIKSDDSSKWRSLRHVFFTAWKDHGTPEKPETLVQFVRTCQGMFGPRGGSQPPILVHCSAGVGRTGTFIALDMCLQKLEVDEDIDIFHLVLDLRECRRCMVQNEKQYTYLYHCVASVIDEIYGSTVQNEPIYENVAALMSGSAC